ncbi:DUF1643 domain-containing protein [uncultured Paraglaciecola sp.]|uniref:DUF1643 domain-containing protein n=1 Tax=uncultured Paraglaciecola sp. TaxID=1765024 RepID=UPI00261536AB|nr:DUF1643 domain-containing protein [uncultured Paraglaciecola sp.]
MASRSRLLTNPAMNQIINNVGPTKSAVISDCGCYRYKLERRWSADKRAVCFIGLNPSTADANLDDPTIRRCVNYAKSWGYGKLIMVNLFAFRATRPKDMMDALDPVGSGNDAWIDAAVAEADITIAAWGKHGSFRDRAKGMIDRHGPQYLKLNKDGSPAHPLYLKKELQPQVWLIEH